MDYPANALQFLGRGAPQGGGGGKIPARSPGTRDEYVSGMWEKADEEEEEGRGSRPTRNTPAARNLFVAGETADPVAESNAAEAPPREPGKDTASERTRGKTRLSPGESPRREGGGGCY